MDGMLLETFDDLSRYCQVASQIFSDYAHEERHLLVHRSKVYRCVDQALFEQPRARTHTHAHAHFLGLLGE